MRIEKIKCDRCGKVEKVPWNNPMANANVDRKHWGRLEIPTGPRTLNYDLCPECCEAFLKTNKEESE